MHSHRHDNMCDDLCCDMCDDMYARDMCVQAHIHQSAKPLRAHVQYIACICMFQGQPCASLSPTVITELLHESAHASKWHFRETVLIKTLPTAFLPHVYRLAHILHSSTCMCAGVCKSSSFAGATTSQHTGCAKKSPMVMDGDCLFSPMHDAAGYCQGGGCFTRSLLLDVTGP